MTLTVDYDQHHLTIHRYVANPKRAIAHCSCGWTTSGSTPVVYGLAAEHDKKLPIPEAKNDHN
jgi:hypothetical protein